MRPPAGPNRTGRVAPFPWGALDRVPREATTALRDVRRVVRRAVSDGAIAGALGQVVSGRVELMVAGLEVIASPDGAGERPLRGASFVLGTTDGSLRVGVELDRDLARRLVAGVTGREARLGDPSKPLDPALTGAAAAIVAAAARRAHGDEAVLVPLGTGELRLAPGERAIRLHATVLVDDDAYAALVTLPFARRAIAKRADGAALLATLGDVPVSMPVVVAVALATRAELGGATRGDAFLPGDGWTVRRDGSALVGRVSLAAPASERAIAGTLGSDGAIVVGGAEGLPLEVQAMTTTDDAGANGAADAVLEAPIVVRVELGAVTLTAREWGALSPGDVVALGRRVSEPVVLRVAGVEVARGELVDIEGELGVRIRDRGGSK